MQSKILNLWPYLRITESFPLEEGTETPGIPDGNPGILAFFSLLRSGEEMLENVYSAFFTDASWVISF